MNRTLHAHDAKLGKLSERSSTVLRNRTQLSAPQVRRRDCIQRAVKTVTAPAPAIAPAQAPVQEPTRPKPARAPLDYNQQVRQGHYEASLMQKQATKPDTEQPPIASVLQPLDPKALLDVLIVGCGPAGMYLAAQVAKQGLKVGIVGRDLAFTNNYGVWRDEFDALGMSDTLEVAFDDAVCYFGEGQEMKVGRPYGRVCRRKLREKLVGICQEAGVTFLAGEVEAINPTADQRTSRVAVQGGPVLTARMVTLAAGGAGGRFLKYEGNAPPVAAQTAYGIEAEVEGYGDAYPGDLMLFMDFRRHHTGVWDGAGKRLREGNHPNSGEGLWGTQSEAPSFLYAMPLGGKRVFLEETCLVARPALPFAVLKRRLERRLRAMGLKVTKIHEEEWSYIPVGGPLPLPSQSVTAFGAAANLVHPATGFSIARSFREAPVMAKQIADALALNVPVQESCALVWNTLWPQEKRRQASFHVFGMELLVNLDLRATNEFFLTFFRLPPFYWGGFLASTLTSMQLIAFAGLVFATAPFSIKYKLISHLLKDPSGQYLLDTFTAELKQQSASPASSAAAQASAAVLLLQLNSLPSDPSITDKLSS